MIYTFVENDTPTHRNDTRTHTHKYTERYTHTHTLLADSKGPSAARISEIVWQLNRIASLPHFILESPESVFELSDIENVACEPLYNLKMNEQSEMNVDKKV